MAKAHRRLTALAGVSALLVLGVVGCTGILGGDGADAGRSEAPPAADATMSQLAADAGVAGSPAPVGDDAVSSANQLPPGPIGDGIDAPDAATPDAGARTSPQSDAGASASDAGASASDAGDPTDPAGCPDDMVALSGFCMDTYEAPNQLGVEPFAFQTAIDGEMWCADRGKRLCSEAEWVRACQGPSGRPYPYGTQYVRGQCDDDKTWKSPDWTVLGTYPSAASKAEATRLYQADPSGSRTECISEEGVMDLTGNVAEWVTRSFPNSGGNYDHVMKGCYWAGCYGGSPPSCSFVNPAHPGTFRTYEGGFRCCQ